MLRVATNIITRNNKLYWTLCFCADSRIATGAEGQKARKLTGLSSWSWSRFSEGSWLGGGGDDLGMCVLSSQGMCHFAGPLVAMPVPKIRRVQAPKERIKINEKFRIDERLLSFQYFVQRELRVATKYRLPALIFLNFFLISSS